METDHKTIEEICSEFYRRMGLTARVRVEQSDEERTVRARVEVDDPHLAIGQNGQTLLDAQQLLRRMVRNYIPREAFFDVDINDYKQKKADYLKEVAADLADDAALTHCEKELPAMPAHERRIIHVTLQEHPRVFTESTGKDDNRRVIIKPR